MASRGAVRSMESINDRVPFRDAKYNSTHVTFRGQDKEVANSLGGNPNMNVEEEYIANLQQQVHFMDLELKILKEKVTEEGSQGIAALFDDDKTSHQHIQLLKTKYQQMRKDFEKKR
jgi:hypothetical protein